MVTRKPPRTATRPPPFTMTRFIRERKARGEKGFTMSGFIRDRDKQERRRQEREERIAAEEINKLIEKKASLPPAEKILVGDRGHWIERHDEPAGDGRQKYSIWSPGAVHHVGKGRR
jgi:hypothetical protein